MKEKTKISALMECNNFKRLSNPKKKIILLIASMLVTIIYIIVTRESVINAASTKQTAVYYGKTRERYVKYEFNVGEKGEYIWFTYGKAIPSMKDILKYSGQIVCISYRKEKYSDKTEMNFVDEIKNGECEK